MMNKLTQLLFLSVLTALYAFSHLVLAQQPTPVVRLVTGPDSEPYVLETAPYGGPLTKLVTEAFSLAGYDHEIDYLPWSRGLRELIEGGYDATFPYIATPEREKLLRFSQPLLTVETRIFQRADDSSTNSISDLKGLTLCLPLGYGIQQPLKDLLSEGTIRLERTRTLESCFRMLRLGRVDFIPINCQLGWYSIRRFNFEPGDFRDDFILETDRLHLVVDAHRPEAKALLDDFDKGWQKLKHSPAWKENSLELYIQINDKHYCEMSQTGGFQLLLNLAEEPQAAPSRNARMYLSTATKKEPLTC